MKKNSKNIRRDYLKYEGMPTCFEFYGVLMKNGRTRIDTKRYKKFFALPNNRIEHRKTVYYTPSKKHRHEYMCNRFRDTIACLKKLWYQEFSKVIKELKTPKQVEDNARVANLTDGLFDYDEASTIGFMSGIKRRKQYNFVVKSIYAQFFQQVMSQIDALCIRVITDNGYKEKKFSKEAFDIFIQGKQKSDVKAFEDFESYSVYDRAYRVWNFLKHNSTKAYNQLKSRYQEMIYDPDENYQNGDISISVLKLDERFILKTLDELPNFFDELCERAFDENVDDAQWDYDDYFYEIVQNQIDVIINPLNI